MLVFTKEEVAKQFDWSNGQDDVYVKFKGGEPYYSHPEARRIYIWLPKDQQRIPNLAFFLANLGYDSRDSDGALLWFSDFGIWNNTSEEIGYQVVESMHIAHGQPLPFSLGIGHEFRSDELKKAVGLLVQGIVFGWDTYYVPRWQWGGSTFFFLKFSHDEYVEITVRTNEFYEKVVSELREWGLTPLDKIEWKIGPKGKMTRPDEPTV